MNVIFIVLCAILFLTILIIPFLPIINRIGMKKFKSDMKLDFAKREQDMYNAECDRVRLEIGNLKTMIVERSMYLQEIQTIRKKYVKLFVHISLKDRRYWPKEWYHPLQRRTVCLCPDWDLNNVYKDLSGQLSKIEQTISFVEMKNTHYKIMAKSLNLEEGNEICPQN